MVRHGKSSRGVSQAPAPVVECISPAPAAVSSLEPVVEFLAPASAVILSATPVGEYIAPVPAMFQASTPVVEYLAPAPAVIAASVEEYVSPVPVGHTARAPAVKFIAPSAHTQYFSLTSVFRHRDTLPDGHWHQESKGHRDSDWFVEIPSYGRGWTRS